MMKNRAENTKNQQACNEARAVAPCVILVQNYRNYSQIGGFLKSYRLF